MDSLDEARLQIHTGDIEMIVTLPPPLPSRNTRDKPFVSCREPSAYLRFHESDDNDLLFRYSMALPDGLRPPQLLRDRAGEVNQGKNPDYYDNDPEM